MNFLKFFLEEGKEDGKEEWNRLIRVSILIMILDFRSFFNMKKWGKWRYKTPSTPTLVHHVFLTLFSLPSLLRP